MMGGGGWNRLGPFLQRGILLSNIGRWHWRLCSASDCARAPHPSFSYCSVIQEMPSEELGKGIGRLPKLPVAASRYLKIPTLFYTVTPLRANVLWIANRLRKLSATISSTSMNTP